MGRYGECSRRDSNPRLRLERPRSLTGLDYGSAAGVRVRVHKGFARTSSQSPGNGPLDKAEASWGGSL